MIQSIMERKFESYSVICFCAITNSYLWKDGKNTPFMENKEGEKRLLEEKWYILFYECKLWNMCIF